MLVNHLNGEYEAHVSALSYQSSVDALHDAAFDAYPFFDALGDTIMTGYTGTNVRDVRCLQQPERRNSISESGRDTLSLALPTICSTPGD